MSRKTHWEDVYTRKAAEEVSWFQAETRLSLELLQAAGMEPQSRVIDVGGGASRLVDGLLNRGVQHVSVLDLSASALQQAQARLGTLAAQVSWIEGDISQVDLPEASYDLWHDRAVFHFLTELEQRAAYVAQLQRALKAGGHVIIATFAPDGPERCSGLPVQRYSAAALQSEIGYPLLDTREESHLTPGGATQHFIYCLFRKPA